MTDHAIRAIRDLRLAAERELGTVEAQLAALSERVSRLRITEEELTAALGATMPSRSKRSRKGKSQGPRAASPPRPVGVPQTPHMICVAIAEAQDRGLPGLRPEETRDFIRAKWWPAVEIDAVGPTMWRMAKRGRLRKNGTVYSLKNETPAVGAAGASRSGSGVNGAAYSPSPPDPWAQRNRERCSVAKVAALKP